jgi:peptidoglycan/LPS O-acetylase OafA/YrhL
VAFSHGAAIPFKLLLSSGGQVAHAFAAVSGVLFNGVAAVSLFFVISGFCIHFPSARVHRLNTRTFLIRRYTRIGGPLIAAWMIIACSPERVASAGQAVLWSVYCELIYYTLYPILFRLFLLLGIEAVLGAATAVSVLLIATHWSYVWQWQFGISVTWLVGLPSWLLGCLIAQKTSHATPPRPRLSIWFWRGGAWIYSVAAIVAVSHSPIVVGYPATLLVFSFYCYFWLRRELERYTSNPPNALLEWAGTWSFSLYLVHNLVIAAWIQLDLPWPLLINWFLKIVTILAASYVFYAVVEYPCHVLARRVGSPITRIRFSHE